MIDAADIRPLSEFQRNAKSFMQRLRRTRQPEVLTVNGKAAVVVQDAAAYSAMIEELERAYVVEAVRVGLEQSEAGKTIPWEQVAREMRAKYGLPRKKRRSA